LFVKGIMGAESKKIMSGACSRRPGHTYARQGEGEVVTIPWPLATAMVERLVV